MLKRMIQKKPGKRKNGQSTVEYIILVAAILAALIVFLAPGGVFQKAFNTAMNTGTTGMEDMANALSSSHG